MKITRREIVAFALLVLVLVGTPVAVFQYEKIHSTGMITVRARIQENGGFTPNPIRVEEGETVRLRIIGEDVLHGVTIPTLGVAHTLIYPGKATIVEFVAHKPGAHLMVCTVICSPLHGLMRAEIIVEPRR